MKYDEQMISSETSQLNTMTKFTAVNVSNIKTETIEPIGILTKQANKLLSIRDLQQK